MYNGIVLGKYYNSNTGNELIIKSQDDKYSAGKIFLGHSDDIDSNNRIIINSYASLKAEYGSTLELGENSEIDVEISSNDTLHRGKLILQNGSNLTTHTQSKIIVKHVGMFENYGANILNSSNFHLDINDGGKYHVIAENYTHTINNGAYIVVTSGTIEIANNSKLIFDGNQSYLNIKSNSNIILGQNASIEFKNGARLIANGSNFYSSGSSNWQGLVFENSGQDSIINCKFTNAKIPIEIINDTITSYFTQKVIRNNTFNIQSGGQYGIKTRDAHNLLIESDSVKLPQSVNSTGIYIYNTYFPGSGDSEEELINIIIKDNVITNGSQSIIIANFTSNLLPVYIGYNKCLDATGSILIGRLMRGAIRGNYFDNHNTSTGKGLVFHQSQPDLALNYIYSSDIAIHNLSNAVINLAPAIKDNSELLWTGGDNTIVSRLSHTIAFNHYSFAKLDRGYNELFRNNSSYHHLYGYLLIDSTRYYARENCFDGYYISSNNLYNINSDSVTVISYSPNYTCSQSIAQTGVFVQDWGDGICDSIPVSSLNNLDSVSGDEIFYSQGLEMMTIGLYPNAIENYKQLINNKPESSYLINALYDLYTCYEELDTSVLQSNRDILYGNLKTYLESKITSGNYTEEFEDNAFQIIVMCETNMSNIELAIEDYEFLSLYHPQPEIRLLASWDYIELEALNGQGGSIKEFKSEDEMTKYIDIISKKIEKKFKGDPIRNRLMKTYKKVNDEYSSKEENLNNELSRAGNAGKEKIMTQKSELDNRKEMNRTASTNLITLRGMSDKQKEERRFNDLMTISGMKNTGTVKSEINNITPEKYELSQNYPNPFNQSTIFKFQCSISGVVKIKVFDLLGREVKTLVNEYKPAGSYIVSFDASSLSSGVYFYRLDVNGFSDVKRMILIK